MNANPSLGMSKVGLNSSRAAGREVADRHFLLLDRCLVVAASQHRSVFRRNILGFARNSLHSFESGYIAAAAAAGSGSWDCSLPQDGSRGFDQPIQCHIKAVPPCDVFGGQ